ncbi:hypothetical protein ASV53_19195 [Photobacterium sanguinicancri]|uniref:Transposase DDE domain-containing protein n=2 Tax=Photobacterium sanguinicancri TaxID=875932 RepID=A0ABX4FTT6_9GAMM|nr:hypothetical protein ASV53_19195 [Photobacterium sanguinicancri]
MRQRNTYKTKYTSDQNRRVSGVTLMPLLPGRSTWPKQLACHDEVQLKTALIRRDKHLIQGRQIQNYNHEITARLPTK